MCDKWQSYKEEVNNNELWEKVDRVSILAYRFSCRSYQSRNSKKAAKSNGKAMETTLFLI